jgi:hypothetical protein
MQLVPLHIGYGSPQTLTDTGLKLAKGQKGDAPTLKPTFMVGLYSLNAVATHSLKASGFNP